MCKKVVTKNCEFRAILTLLSFRHTLVIKHQAIVAPSNLLFLLCLAVIADVRRRLSSLSSLLLLLLLQFIFSLSLN